MKITLEFVATLEELLCEAREKGSVTINNETITEANLIDTFHCCIVEIIKKNIKEHNIQNIENVAEVIYQHVMEINKNEGLQFAFLDLNQHINFAIKLLQTK